jgi:serine/threonine-protein kinase
MTTRQPLTPPILDHLVRRCLAKDPEDRWQSIHDVVADLEWVGWARSQTETTGTVAVRRRARERSWAAATLLFALASAVLAALYLRGPRALPPQPMRFSLVPPNGAALAPGPAALNIPVRPEPSLR